MNRHLCSFLFSFLLFIPFAYTQNGLPYPVHSNAQKGIPADEFLEGTVILKIKPEFRHLCGPGSISIPQIQTLCQILGVTSLEKTIPGAQPPRLPKNDLGQKMADLSLIYTLKFAGSTSVADATNMLNQSPAVEYAEPHFIYQAFYSPSDPDTGLQYYLPLIRAYEAWDISHGDTNVVIGIIDTGTSFSHPDLDGKHAINLNDPIDGLDNDNDGYIDNWRGWDFGGDVFGGVGGDNEPQYVGTAASNDHGVLVGGVATAATDNGINIASIGFNTRQLPVRVAVSNGLAIVYGYQGLIYAADHGADIINLSWGGGTRSRFGEDAVNYATINKAKMVVAAAGNTPGEINFFPASFPNVISVAGTQQNDAFWLNNPSLGTSYSYFVDICAPARSIRTLKGNSGSLSFNGTSLAAPIVCGAAALVKAEFPNYSNMQVAQRVRMSADLAIYALNTATYTDKMGRGRLDCYQALVDTSPSIRVLDIEFKDDDGHLKAGDTVDVWVKFINWLDPVENLDITLTSVSPALISVLNGQLNVGALGTMDTVASRLCPFRIVLGPGSGNGVLRFSYSGTNYTDQEFYQVVMEPNTFVNCDWNDTQFSVGNTGEFGVMNYPTSNQGLGLDFRDVGGIISEAGLLVGNGPANIADNMTRIGGFQNTHFTAMGNARRSVPGAIAELEADMKFNSSGIGSGMPGLEIDLKVYQFRSETDNGYSILEYSFKNTTASTMSNVHTALFADYDAGYYLQNQVNYVPSARMVYVDDPIDHFNPYLFGMSLLTPDSLRAYAKPVAGFGFSMAEKWNAMTAPPDSVNNAIDDIFAFLGTGPFNIGAGQTHIVAYAQAGGVDSTELVNFAKAAYDKYWCVIRGNMTNLPDLGADINHCGEDTTLVLNPGAGFASYLWSDGSTSPTLTVDSAGTWRVTVTDANGCSHHSDINISMHPGIEAGFTVNPSNVILGDTVYFTDTTSFSIETLWNIDGVHYCPDTNVIKHVFPAYGNYQVYFVNANQYCFDTAYYTVFVDTLVGISSGAPLENTWTIFPNPTQGSFTVEWNAADTGPVELYLMDGMGREIRHWEGNKTAGFWQKQLEPGKLPNGLYFLEIRTRNGKSARQIVISN